MTLGSVWRWVVSFMPWLVLPGVRTLVLTEQEAGYASAPPSLLSRQKLLPLPWSQSTIPCSSSPWHSIWTELSGLLFLILLKKINCNMCIVLVNTWLERNDRECKTTISCKYKECVMPYLHWCPTVCRSEGNLNKNYIKDSNWHVVREHLLLYRVSYLWVPFWI